MSDKTKYGYEAWFGFSDETMLAVASAMQGATYEVHRRSDGYWGSTRGWTETRPIRWSIRWAPDQWDGVWVLYVSAQAAINEAERRATRAIYERLQPGTRIRLTHRFHAIDGRNSVQQAGLPGWVNSIDWQRGVSVLMDGISGEHDIGKFWIVPIDDTPTTPKAKAGGIYQNERSIK